jgi:hypothetical protein
MANRSILELMTSLFGSKSMKYCSSKVLLEAKLLDQKFFRNLRQRDFDSAAPASMRKAFSMVELSFEIFLIWSHPQTGCPQNN